MLMFCQHPSNGRTAHIGPWPPLLRFCNSSFFYGMRLLAPRPTPNLEDQVSVFMTPEIGWPSYTPGHWVARVPRGCHSPYPLLWAPEGRYFVNKFYYTVWNLFLISGYWVITSAVKNEIRNIMM
jgi:hypothetical protein